VKKERSNHRKDLFETISLDYDRGIYDAHAASVLRLLQKNFYARLAGKRVLDIGNGGESPAKILGPDIASSLPLFVGLDNSWSMIRRGTLSYPKIRGDGLHLPFKDGAFDCVILNGVFHHLGFRRQEDSLTKVAGLLQEAVRVCQDEVIVYEIYISSFLEKLQKLMANILGEMSPFVYSERTLDRLISRLGLSRSEVVLKSLSDLLGPFHWNLVMMDHPWFKLPAFLSPIRHGFFAISGKGKP
jgi:SAM-dependent methyltransferase